MSSPIPVTQEPRDGSPAGRRPGTGGTPVLPGTRKGRTGVPPVPLRVPRSAASQGTAFPGGRWFAPLLLCALALLTLTSCADDTFASRAARFFSFRDGAVRAALAGSLLLGLNCGILGGFLVARRMAMFGDTLSHAVLPGIAGGFLWNMSRDPVALITGSILTGVLSSLIVSWIGSTTRLKPDAALSVVLTVFFAAGIALIKILPDGNKAGLDRFLYGQAAAIGPDELRLLAAAAAVTLVCLALFYRGFLVLAFDEAFGSATGLPMRALHYLLMFLTTLAIVVSMQAVGVILVSGLLVIPASTAWLLTDRLPRALLCSALLGMAAAFSGAFLSFTGSKMAMGPTLVLCASGFFFIAFLVSPRGLLRRAWQHLRQHRRIRREDTLKALYRILEDRAFTPPHITRAEAETSGCGPDRLSALQAKGLLGATGADGPFELTPAGFSEASRIVRNHRLWELYLTRRAGYADDHVHDDAEAMEHMLAEENVAELLHSLGDPRTDPHGKRIPAPHDTVRSAAGHARPS